MTDTKQPTEKRVVLPVDPTRRTEIDKQRVPMSARPYRLLALVKQDAVVRVQKEPDDTVMTWPHLLSIEFLAAGVMSIFLLLMGLFINAPLEELANGNVTPAVAKAPWYLVGIQELLAYFHPTVAGAIPILTIFIGIGVYGLSVGSDRLADALRWVWPVTLLGLGVLCALVALVWPARRGELFGAAISLGATAAIVHLPYRRV